MEKLKKKRFAARLCKCVVPDSQFALVSIPTMPTHNMTSLSPSSDFTFLPSHTRTVDCYSETSSNTIVHISIKTYTSCFFIMNPTRYPYSSFPGERNTGMTSRGYSSPYPNMPENYKPSALESEPHLDNFEFLAPNPEHLPLMAYGGYHGQAAGMRQRRKISASFVWEMIFSKSPQRCLLQRRPKLHILG